MSYNVGVDCLEGEEMDEVTYITDSVPMRLREGYVPCSECYYCQPHPKEKRDGIRRQYPGLVGCCVRCPASPSALEDDPCWAAVYAYHGCFSGRKFTPEELVAATLAGE